jgi:WD40 repeat protein
MQQLDEPIPIEALRPEVPLSVAKILRRMMAKDPAQRFQTALEVNHALTAVAAEVAFLPVDPPRQADMSLVESTAECVVEPAQPGSVLVPDLEPPPAIRSTPPEPSVDWPSILNEPLQAGADIQKLISSAPSDSSSNKDFQWKSLDELPPAHARDPSYRTPLDFEGKPPSTIDEPIPGPPTQVTLPEIPDIPLNTAAQIQLEWSRRLDEKTSAPRAVPLELIKGHRGCVVSLAFAHQEDLLATAGIDGSVKLWRLDGARSKLLSVLQTGGSEVHSIAFAPGDQFAAYGTVDGRLWLCLIAGEQSGPYDVLQLERERINCVRFSADGRYLGVAVGKQLTIFEMKTDKLRRWAELGPHDGAALAFEFCPTGKFVAVISRDGTVRIWNPHRYWQKLVGRINIPDVNCLAYSPDGKLLALGTSSRSIQIWDMAANPPQRFSRMAYNHGSLRLVMFPPDRQGLLTVEDQGFAALRDLQTGNNMQEWSVPFVKAYTFALATDGRSLATGNTDGTVLIHSL